MTFQPGANSDLIDEMIAFDEGRLSGVEIVSLFQQLIDDGSVWHLQGCYGRMAQHLIETGHCLLAPVNHRDYYGNVVPSRDDVPAGQPGTESFAERQRLTPDDLPF